MKTRHHRCQVLSSPWPGVFATDAVSTREYGRHWHTTFGIGLMERGAHSSLSDRGRVDAYAGDIITSNPGEIHDGRPLGTASRHWRMIYFDADAMRAIARDAGVATRDVRIAQPVIRDARLTRSLRRLLARLERWNSPIDRSPDAALACEEVLVDACGRLLRSHSTIVAPADARHDVALVRDRLADHLVATPSLAELAAIVGLSRYQLLRRFERAYGMTPFEWQRQIRTERARRLIDAGSALADVAIDCGFADQSHMTRAFVEHFGFTPGARAVITRRSTAASAAIK